MGITTSDFFFFFLVLTWDIFPYFCFNLSVSCSWQYTPCKHHIFGFCFLKNYVGNIWLLVIVFSINWISFFHGLFCLLSCHLFSICLFCFVPFILFFIHYWVNWDVDCYWLYTEGKNKGNISFHHDADVTLNHRFEFQFWKCSLLYLWVH